MKTSTTALFTVLTLLACSSTSLASDGGGSSGGGNSVVCFDDPSIPQRLRQGNGDLLNEYIPHITSVEAFDLYEAKLKRGIPPIAPILAEIKEGESFQDYLTRIRRRLAQAIPDLAGVIHESAELLPNDHIVWNDHGIMKINDQNSVGEIDSVNCVLATTAVQYQINEQFYLHIDQRLFYHPKHSEWSKAALLMHELLYRKARATGQTDSRSTRSMVAKLLTNDPSTRLYDVVDLAQDLGFMAKNKGLASLEYLKTAAPVSALASAIWNTRWGGTYVFEQFIPHPRSEIPDQNTLLSSAYSILRELKDPATPDNVGQAIAYLNLKSGMFYNKLKNPKAAMKTLDDLNKFLEARKIATKNKMIEIYKEKREKFGFQYLSENQRIALDRTAEDMIDRMVRFAGTTKTKEDLEWERKTHPGVIRVATNIGVYCFEDLSLSTNLTQESFQRIKAADEWVDANLQWSLGNNGWETKEVLFPVF